MSRRLTLAGWVAFSGSGVLYLISGIRSRDAWVVWGSVVWLCGVTAFLAAMFWPTGQRVGRRGRSNGSA